MMFDGRPVTEMERLQAVWCVLDAHSRLLMSPQRLPVRLGHTRRLTGSLLRSVGVIGAAGAYLVRRQVVNALH
jgi:hypothetical protein